MSFSKITIIGSGNVAFHLAKQMQQLQLPLVEVVARPSAALVTLGKKCKVKVQDDFSKCKVHSGLYLIAVSDDAIAKVIKLLPAAILKKGKIVHTSGATASSIFKKYATNYGAFWPLQTFSKSRKVNFKKLPFIITASNASLAKKLTALAISLGGVSQLTSDADRLRYHCAAVLVNNFSNHLFQEAQSFLAKENLPFEVLHPLMMETVKKAILIGPAAAQTGPAKREDEKTMKRHLALLDSELKQLYKVLSDSIQGTPEK